MKQYGSYIGFPPLPDNQKIVQALLYDPPDARWRVVRDLFRIVDEVDRRDLIERLQPHLSGESDFRVRYRILIALKALHHVQDVENYVLVKGRGAFRQSSMESADSDSGDFALSPPPAEFFPVIDFHIHPKTSDLTLLSAMREAGVSHGVVLATDTDPSDLDRPEIREKLRQFYSQSCQSRIVPFEKIVNQVKASIHSPTHVENRDVADWVNDYPHVLIGFGSVNLSRSRDYVERVLEDIRRLKLRGVKLAPHSQFFNPARNPNMDLLFKHCSETGSVILSHAGCGCGPFEIPELCRDARPHLWENLLKKYPDVPLVFAHFGAYSSIIPGIWLHDVLQMGKKYRNVYADLAGVDWLLDREMVVVEIRKTMGFDRVLFGTDYPLPLTGGSSLSYLVGSLKTNSLLSEKERRQVLGLNAARLFGIY